MTGIRTISLMLLIQGVSAFAQSGQADAAYRTSPGFSAYRRGGDLFSRSQFDAALVELDEALRLDPKLVPALTLKAKLAMSVNRYDLAREYLERALAANPAAWYAQFLYGFQYYRQNEMPRAVTELEKARRLNPADPRAALYLGLSQETLGDTGAALSLYREAIRLEESSAKPSIDPLLAGARLLLVLGDLEECAKLIRRAVQVEPSSRDGHFEWGRLLLRRGSPADAVREGETALKLRSGDVTDRQIRFLLIQAYRASGREREAAENAEAIRREELLSNGQRK